MPALFSSKDIERFREFLNVGGKKILVYHRDADGISASSLLLKWFPEFERIPRKGPKMDKTFLKQVEKKDPFLVIFLDIPIDQEYKDFKKLASKLPSCRFAIIDHHIVEHNMNKEGMLHINPRFKLENSYIPASYVMYRLLDSMGFDIKKYIWIAAVGVVGDHAFDECKELIDECEKLLPGLTCRDIKSSRVGKVADLVSSAITSKGYKGASSVLEMLIDSEKIEEIEKNKELIELKEEVDKEFKKLIETFKTDSKEHKKANLIEYGIQTKYSLSSTVSGHVSEKNPNKIIFIYKKSDGGFKISLRYQKGDINLGSVVKKCTGPDDSAGGHERAAGGFIMDIDSFREKLIKELEK